MTDQGRYAGMTVNERLFDAGLIDAFDAAARASDRAEMIRLLIEVGVEGAEWSADTILACPNDKAIKAFPPPTHSGHSG